MRKINLLVLVFFIMTILDTTSSFARPHHPHHNPVCIETTTCTGALANCGCGLRVTVYDRSSTAYYTYHIDTAFSSPSMAVITSNTPSIQFCKLSNTAPSSLIAAVGTPGGPQYLVRCCYDKRDLQGGRCDSNDPCGADVCDGYDSGCPVTCGTGGAPDAPSPLPANEYRKADHKCNINGDCVSVCPAGTTYDSGSRTCS